MIINRFGSLLKVRGITVPAFALRSGKASQWVYELCRPDKSINSHTLNLICEVLHVQPGDVLEYVPDALYVPPPPKEPPPPSEATL